MPTTSRCERTYKEGPKRKAILVITPNAKLPTLHSPDHPDLSSDLEAQLSSLSAQVF